MGCVNVWCELGLAQRLLDAQPLGRLGREEAYGIVAERTSLAFQAFTLIQSGYSPRPVVDLRRANILASQLRAVWMRRLPGL